MFATPISVSKQTKAFISEDYGEAYHCTSKESPLVADVIIGDDCDKITCVAYNDEGEASFSLNFIINEIDDCGTAYYTAYNELEEPILSAKYNLKVGYMEITEVFVNDIVTRASVAAWGCNISIGLCGAIWSTAFGMVSAGAGFAVGLAYTCMAIEFCSGL